MEKRVAASTWKKRASQAWVNGLMGLRAAKRPKSTEQTTKDAALPRKNAETPDPGGDKRPSKKPIAT